MSRMYEELMELLKQVAQHDISPSDGYTDLVDLLEEYGVDIRE